MKCKRRRLKTNSELITMLNKELRKHILRTLQAGLRFDGRGMEDFREITVEKGISKNAEGSARVKIGGTEVLAGVKMSIEKPYPDTPNEGTLMVNAELTPLSSPEFESGPPGDDAIEIARVVDRGIRESKAIDLKALCIAQGEKAWGISVDIVSINDEGNLMDAAALAALAALTDAKFPGLTEEGKVDYKHPTTKKIAMTNMPIAVTITKIGDKILVDTTIEEKETLDARLTVTSLEDGTICSMQKGGDEGITSAELSRMLDIAQQKAKELRAKVQ